VTGTYRHGRTYCQVAGCQARVRRAAEIELPMAWEKEREYTSLTVLVGLCQHHGREIDRRVQAMLSARSVLPALLTVIDGAIETEERQHRHLCELTAEVACLREHTNEQRERADLAEWAMELVQRRLGAPIVLGPGDFEMEAALSLVSALSLPSLPEETV
jgi:hypothetical protein